MINTGAKNQRHLHVMTLIIHGPEAWPSEVKIWGGDVLLKKRNFLEVKIESLTCEVEKDKELLIGSLKTGVRGVHKNITWKRITEAVNSYNIVDPTPTEV